MRSGFLARSADAKFETTRDFYFLFMHDTTQQIFVFGGAVTVLFIKEIVFDLLG